MNTDFVYAQRKESVSIREYPRPTKIIAKNEEVTNLIFKEEPRSILSSRSLRSSWFIIFTLTASSSSSDVTAELFRISPPEAVVYPIGISAEGKAERLTFVPVATTVMPDMLQTSAP